MSSFWDKEWDEANSWVEEANKDKDEFKAPTWSFDCGFKLDFDGPLMSVSSRFYPPKSHYGPKWDGQLSVYFGDKEIASKEFECDTLDSLKAEVESFVSDVTKKVSEFLGEIIWE